MTLDQSIRAKGGSNAEKAARFLAGLAPVMQIVALRGLSCTTVCKVVALSVAGGWAAIEPAARGRSASACRLLTAEQEASLRRTTSGKRREQLKVEPALWTRGPVMQFIEPAFGAWPSIHATSSTCAAGLHARESIERACGQRPDAARRWLEHEVPAIERGAKTEGGEVHRGDETAPASTQGHGSRWRPSPPTASRKQQTKRTVSNVDAHRGGRSVRCKLPPPAAANNPASSVPQRPSRTERLPHDGTAQNRRHSLHQPLLQISAKFGIGKKTVSHQPLKAYRRIMARVMLSPRAGRRPAPQAVKVSRTDQQVSSLSIVT
jgi:hypothetical protein